MKDTGSSNLTDSSRGESDENLESIDATAGAAHGESSSSGDARKTRSRTISQDKKDAAVSGDKKEGAVAAGGGTPAPATAGGQLITTEEREVGNVDMKVYMKWATAAGGLYVGREDLLTCHYCR